MSHHEEPINTPVDHEEMEANSRADALALLSLVTIIVVMAVFFVAG
jgi:hypothetical protein